MRTVVPGMTRFIGQFKGVFVALTFLLLAGCGDIAQDSPSSPDPTSITPEAGDESGPIVTSSTTTTTPAEESTTTSEPQGVTEVNFEGLVYQCDDGRLGKWTCTRSTGLIYCDGYSAPTSCSELWYPSELNSVRLVVFDGVDYACQVVGSACVAYQGGPPPTSFFNPSVWCEGLSCSHYDPAEWFELTVDFTDYFCEESIFGFQHFDCYQSFGSPPSYTALDPDVYCSGPKILLDCSENWYPDELDQYEIVLYNGGEYICERSYLGGFQDYDCGFYSGGDPSYVFGNDLKCTDRGYQFECNPSYYPSELDGMSLTTIGGYEYICRDSYGGSECFRYFGGSPSSVMYGMPDLYCNYLGLCDPYGYP